MTGDDADSYEIQGLEQIPACTTDGDAQTWTLKFSCHTSGLDYLVHLSDADGGEWEGFGHNVFSAFADARSEPEAHGFRFLVIGARPDYWPSGMSSSMGGGVALYRHYPSALRRLVGDLVDVVMRRGSTRYMFDPAPLSKVATASEQKVFRAQWKMRII